MIILKFYQTQRIQHNVVVVVVVFVVFVFVVVFVVFVVVAVVVVVVLTSVEWTLHLIAITLS